MPSEQRPVVGQDAREGLFADGGVSEHRHEGDGQGATRQGDGYGPAPTGFAREQGAAQKDTSGEDGRDGEQGDIDGFECGGETRRRTGWGGRR